MKKSILICSPDESWSSELERDLKDKGLVVVTVRSGKECQQHLYQNKTHHLVLDLETRNHSSFEVLKYIKLTHVPVDVIIYCRSHEWIRNLQMDEGSLIRLGANEVFFEAGAAFKIRDHLVGSDLSRWKNVQSEDNPAPVNKKIPDHNFTRIRTQDLIGVRYAIFDHYIRLGPNSYVKVVHQGHSLDRMRIDKLIADKVGHLYFLNEDRTLYINFMNETIQKINTSEKLDPQAVVHLQNLSEKFIEEAFTVGIKPELVQEGKSLADNMFNTISKDALIGKQLQDLEELAPTAYSHSFLVSFFSMIICKNLKWVTGRTRESVLMGALMHDIGLLQLPQNLREKPCDKMTAAEKTIYEEHSLLGYQMLSKSPIVSDQVRLIVLQHHEQVSGIGYPYKLTGIRIFPPAKIVALADCFVGIMTTEKISPIEALKFMLQKREILNCYDSETVTALANGFIRR